MNPFPSGILSVTVLLQILDTHAAFLWALLFAGLSLVRPAYRWRPPLREDIHTRRRRQADHHLRRLARIGTASRQMSYLRDVNPFVFEEMILTALQRRGHRIRRNERYSHDGGVDGQVVIRGRLYLIQAKRYRQHLNPSHVADFARLCRESRRRGLLVHTGALSRESLRVARKGKVEIIGGEPLLNILLQRRRRLFERI